MNISNFPDFSPLTLEHKEQYAGASKLAQQEICELCLAEILCWSGFYKPFVSRLNENLIIKLHKNDTAYYYPPLGDNLVPQTIREILLWQKNSLPRAEVCSIPEQTAAMLRAHFADITLIDDRDDADYLYLASDLAELKGAKYDGKRNHIKKFNAAYKHEFIILNPGTAKDCLKFQDEWCQAKKCEGNEMLTQENEAVKEALGNFGPLGLDGAAAVIDGKIKGFTLSAQLNDSTAVILFEKANPETKGIYQALNCFYAQHLAKQFTYINREQDHGVPGLRKAKLSYQPHRMIHKFKASI